MSLPQHANPAPGHVLGVNLVGANAGDVWTGFEWVPLDRYEQMRQESPWLGLPPVQPVPGVDPLLNMPPQPAPPPLVPPLSDASPRAVVPIPLGVVYDEASDNFYARDTGERMNDAFYHSWRAARYLFPTPAPTAAPATAILPVLGHSDFTGLEERVLASAGAGERHEIDPNRKIGTTVTGRMSIERYPLTFVEELLRFVGEDPQRGGLLETPARVAKAWRYWTSGYEKDPAEILKVFEDGAEGVTEMVVVRDIPIYSKCEHHLADIFGTATIGYLPDGKIVGLSKLNRLADMFARRLQVQERMTNQIADALMEHLAPLGCGVVITARHMCMESRGVQQGSNTTTSALRGLFKSDPTVRAEFLALARS